MLSLRFRENAMTQEEFNARADRYFNYAIVIVLIAFLKMFIEGIPQ